MDLECKLNEINWRVNDITFPYDYPGHFLYSRPLYGSELERFRDRYRILNMERFNDLINYIKLRDKKKDFQTLIL